MNWKTRLRNIFLFSLLVIQASCGGGGSSSAKAITAYSLNGVVGTINESNKTIAVTMPFGTNVTVLVATFSTTGESVSAAATPQTSGMNANDFTNPLIYTVTAEDGSTASYTVKVTLPITIKVLSDSRHAYNTIYTTVRDTLLFGTYTSDQFIFHSTNLLNGGISANPADALNTTATYYNETGIAVPSQAPYQLFTTSATQYSGDTVFKYNFYKDNDLVHNYAFTAATTLPTPPAFHTAPGGGPFASAAGVEWMIDNTVFCVAPPVTLSCLTAANAGILAWVRFNHPTWNWFDVKAALRQTGTNWQNGYSSLTYGYGQVNHLTANALTDNQIFLQPPPASVSTLTGQITFTVYPFRQTRRVKEALFQFPTAPATTTAELTLAQIQALGGTKITEYTSTSATSTLNPIPISTAVTNGYFVWFTADNASDSTANFSRIDSYSVLGPVTQ